MLSAPSVQRGSVTFDSTAGTESKTITLSPAVTKSRAHLQFTHRTADNATRDARNLLRGTIAADGSSITFSRFETSFSSTTVVEWEVIEFAAGDVTVQHGSVNPTAASTDYALGTAVDTSRSIYFVSQGLTASFFTSVYAKVSFTGSGANLNLAFNSGNVPASGQAVHEYQVLTFASGLLSVQHGAKTLNGATEETTGSVTISSVGSDISKSFVGWTGYGNLGNDYGRTTVQHYLTGTTTLFLERNPAGTTQDIVSSYFVATFLDRSTVRSGQGTIADTATGTSSTQTLSPAVDTARSISWVTSDRFGNANGANDGTNDPATGFSQPADNLASRAIQSGGASVTVQRTGTSKQLKVAWQVIEFGVDPTFTTEIVHDDFSRLSAAELLSSDATPAPTNTPGNSWVAATGGSGFKGATGGGKLLVSVDGGGNPGAFALDVASADQRVKVSLDPNGGSPEGYIFLRQATSGSTWEAYGIFWSYSSSAITLRRFDAGVSTNLLTISSVLPNTAAHTVEFEAYTNGSGNPVLTIWVDGRHAGSYTDSNASKKTTGNYVVLYGAFSTAIADDFYVYSSTAGGGATYTLTAAQGSYTYTGVAAALKFNRVLTAAKGSYTYTGVAAGLKFNRVLSASQGSYTLTGQAAALKFNRVLAASTGSYTLTGIAASLKYNRVLTASVGSYTLTGIAAGLKFNRVLTAARGTYTLTGNAATLDYTAGATYTLTAVAGSFTLNGQNASLLAGRRLTAAAGSYSLTGNDVRFAYSGGVTWTPVTTNTGTWTPVATNDETWTPVSTPSPITWN